MWSALLLASMIYANGIHATETVYPHSEYAVIEPSSEIIIVSGQAADDENEVLHQDTLDEAVNVALGNVEKILQKAGATMADVRHITMAVRDNADWKGSAKAYENFFTSRGITKLPARNTVQVVHDAEYRVLFTATAAKKVSVPDQK